MSKESSVLRLGAEEVTWEVVVDCELSKNARVMDSLRVNSDEQRILTG